MTDTPLFDEARTAASLLEVRATAIRILGDHLPDVDLQAYAADLEQRHTRDQLRAVAIARGITTAGTKKDLALRLTRAGVVA